MVPVPRPLSPLPAADAVTGAAAKTVVAVSTTFVLQVLSYGVTNLGYALFGAISFPFVSYGGTALVFNALLMGCMLSVFRMGPWVRDSVAAVQKV